MSKYRKTLAAFGAFLGVAAAALADGSVDSTEASGLVIAAAGVVAVYAFPNAKAAE